MASRFGAGVGVDMTDLKAFRRALTQAAPKAAADFRKSLIVAGNIVKDEAVSIASQHSTSIPPTIRTSVRGLSVSVLAGGGSKRGLARKMFNAGYGTAAADKATSQLEAQASGPALPGLYEFGNKGKGRDNGDSGTFRHPELGNREVWVDQPRYAFLRPAARNKATEMEAEVLKVADQAIRILSSGGY